MVNPIHGGSRSVLAPRALGLAAGGLAAAVLLAACSARGGERDTAREPGRDLEHDLGHADAELPAGVGRVAPADPPAVGAPLVFAELRLEPQPGWVVVEPANAMRLAQFVLPRVEGDDADGELVVYHFGGGGGGVDANVERWCGQFEQPDGRASQDVVAVTRRAVGDEVATEVRLEGTYVGETFPGSGVFERDEGRALRAAIVPSSQGQLYAKLLGPRRTIAHWDASWEAFLDALDG